MNSNNFFSIKKGDTFKGQIVTEVTLIENGIKFTTEPNTEQEAFVWTDTEVKEIIKDIQLPGGDRVKDLDLYLSTFKQSKSTPKEDKYKVTDIRGVANDDNSIFVEFSTRPVPEKYESIKQAIEKELNQK